jgi:hypothetical protein
MNDLNKIKKVEVYIGEKTIGMIDVSKDERALLLTILTNVDPLIYTKGQTASLRINKSYSKEFKVKKSFAVHGFREGQLFVTIPVSIETLRGLGFVGKVK